MWNLRNNLEEFITPRVYSSGKSQDIVVKEVEEQLENNDIVVLKGTVGSGKSGIGLHLIKDYGSGIIVVPTKVLEKQYTNDYCIGKKYHIRISDDKNLQIDYMMGKGNFKCKYFEDKIFCCDNETPCSRRLEKTESRLSVASECPYWSPIYPDNLLSKAKEWLEDREIHQYTSVRGTRFYFEASEPCEYYNQFLSYTKDCALIMNLAKWEIETWIGRKSKVPIEILDEGDLWLDQLSYKVSISREMFTRLQLEGSLYYANIIAVMKRYEELTEKIPDYEGQLNEEISSFILFMIDKFSEYSSSGSFSDRLQKLSFISQHFDQSFVKIYNKRLTVFIPRPDVTLKEIKKRCGKLILMSATMHELPIMQSIFTINPPIVRAETKDTGTLYIMVTKKELQVNYKNWVKEDFQTQYFDLIREMVTYAKKPCLVQVHAMKYIPREYEKFLNKGFINGVSWSTVTDRGIDLPDDACRSIVLVKYPIPDTQDIVLKTMQKLLGYSRFWDYMSDNADRNLLQQCGRSVRHNDDWSEIWSPDITCLKAINRLWNGKKEIKYFDIDSAKKENIKL